jgi:hypothetical protein
MTLLNLASGWSRSIALLTLLAASTPLSCKSTASLPAEEAEALEDSPPREPPWLAERAGLLGQAEQRCRRAQQVLDSGPRSYGQLVELAQALLGLATLQQQIAAMDWLVAEESASLEEVLQAESEISAESRSVIAGLCERGVEAAEAASGLQSGPVAAHHLLAAHLALLSSVQGTVRAALSGTGLRIQRSLQAALARDPHFDACAPLRLQGRFRTQAPWPLRDLALARESLQECVRFAATPLHHLFLGDTLYHQERIEAARRHWQQVLVAKPDASTVLSQQPLEFLARQRLQRIAQL